MKKGLPTRLLSRNASNSGAFDFSSFSRMLFSLLKPKTNKIIALLLVAKTGFFNQVLATNKIGEQV
nr:hypothetical protein [uncultured Sediminibacterium sp.]